MKPPKPPVSFDQRVQEPSCSIVVRNRQRTKRIDPRLLHRIARVLLSDILNLTAFDLSVQLVGIPEIVRLNETFLRHAGPTDVIAFDYREPGGPLVVHGEICICVPVAVRQAKQFRTNWETEVVRYLVHGVLHLCGHEDSASGSRRIMKRAEDNAVARLNSIFYLKKVGGEFRNVRTCP